MNNIDNVIITMPLTEEVMRTHFYDTFDDYQTLEYTDKSYKLDEYSEKKLNISIRCSFILKQLHQKKTNMCHTYIGVTMMIYSRSSVVLSSVLLIC